MQRHRGKDKNRHLTFSATRVKSHLGGRAADGARPMEVSEDLIVNDAGSQMK